jgi:hypothetical protein
MRSQNSKIKYLVLLCSSVFILLSGCTNWDVFLAPEGYPSDQEIYAGYYHTELGVSDAADVLTTIAKPEYELLSQSKSVVASAGQKEKGYKSWLTMVTFDEDELMAKRKYLFIIDDRPNILEEPRGNLSFDCQMVLESEVLDEPYANEKARRIAILKQVQEYTCEDISEVGSDNKTVKICGMLINQVLDAVLLKLDKSPVLAASLSDDSGVEFDHINLDKGRIQMLVEGDIVTVKIRTGSLARTMEAEKEQSKGEIESMVEP